jgi:hypothetical protein
MIPTTTLVGWLLAEGLSGSFAPWRWFLGRSLRMGGRIMRQQAVLDRLLASAERGDGDAAIPSLPQ